MANTFAPAPPDLGKHYEYLAMFLAGILSDFPKLLFEYNLLGSYYLAEKPEFKDQKVKLLAYMRYYEQKEINYLDWKKSAGTLTKYEKTLVQQIGKQLEDTQEISNTIAAHTATLIKRSAKRTVYLRIEDILQILDANHSDYMLLRNEIIGVSSRVMCYEFHNRLHFLNKKGETCTVDYLTDSPIGDVQGRSEINELVASNDFEDVKYKVVVA